MIVSIKDLHYRLSLAAVAFKCRVCVSQLGAGEVGKGRIWLRLHLQWQLQAAHGLCCEAWIHQMNVPFWTVSKLSPAKVTSHGLTFYLHLIHVEVYTTECSWCRCRFAPDELRRLPLIRDSDSDGYFVPGQMRLLDLLHAFVKGCIGYGCQTVLPSPSQSILSDILFCFKQNNSCCSTPTSLGSASVCRSAQEPTAQEGSLGVGGRQRSASTFQTCLGGRCRRLFFWFLWVWIGGDLDRTRYL